MIKRKVTVADSPVEVEADPHPPNPLPVTSNPKKEDSVRRMQRFGMALGLVVAGLMAFAGCSSKSPLEKMIENRARYSVEVNGFYIEETPVVGEVDAEMEVDAADADEIELEGVEEQPVAVIQNAHLDLLLKHDSFEKLPGITLDITQVDANKTEKGHWRLWVDTSKVERANPTQYSHVIENLDYEEGDGFAAEVRNPVPESERGDYREFSEVGG
jgi:hypothetical protein